MRRRLSASALRVVAIGACVATSACSALFGVDFDAKERGEASSRPAEESAEAGSAAPPGAPGESSYPADGGANKKPAADASPVLGCPFTDVSKAPGGTLEAKDGVLRAVFGQNANAPTEQITSLVLEVPGDFDVSARVLTLSATTFTDVSFGLVCKSDRSKAGSPGASHLAGSSAAGPAGWYAAGYKGGYTPITMNVPVDLRLTRTGTSATGTLRQGTFEKTETFTVCADAALLILMFRAGDPATATLDDLRLTNVCSDDFGVARAF